jgi:hypothetical protein
MYKKLACCNHCQQDFSDFTTAERANHSRWCDKNPKRSEYVKTNNGSQMHTSVSIEKRNAGIKQAHVDGKYIYAPQKSVETRKTNGTLSHKEETIELLRRRALASSHRRLVRSIREYTKKDGAIVMLDSSWEEVLASRLDELNISWIRPNPIKWVDENGLQRNYFPDFYLVDYDLYLDPKNPIAYKNQLKKITILLKTYNNIRFLTTLDECKGFEPF